MAQEQPETVPRGDGQTIPHWHSPSGETIRLVEAEDSTVIDDQGREYLDFVSQLYCVNAGHSNEAIIEAAENQLRRAPYIASSKHNDTRDQLADALADIAPGALSDVYFSISGSEANEAAMTIARKVQDAPKILTRWQSYHGGTYGSGSLTGDPSTRSTLERYAATTNTGKFLPPLPEAFGTDDPDELARRAADHVEFVIQNEGADSIAAIFMEPVAGSSGAYTAPPGYFERLREICDEYDILLVADEVITGFGRCGDWFGINTENVEPDMITFAKGITSAYIPLAGVIAADWIGEEIAESGHDLGQTFAGHPVACAAGLATIEEYDNGLLDNVAELTPVFDARLERIEEEYDVVGTTRGRGFLRSIVFEDPETGEPFVNPWANDDDEDNPVDDVRKAAMERGVMFGSGRPNVQLLASPPLCTTRAEIESAFDALEAAIEDVFY